VSAGRIPVVALTGHLGAGKTTLLNHVLRQPGARLGVVVNDFGDIDVDVALVSGQVDAPVSIAGGCLCCVVDDDRLDEALEALSAPRLGLDAIVVEASGVAEPAALAAMIRFSGAERVRPGGVVEVVDALHHLTTVDTGGRAPVRYAAATLVVLNKCDQLPEGEREQVLARIEERIRSVNPHVPLVRTSGGRIDPALLFDVADDEDPVDQLPFAAAAREEHPHGGHEHARSASATSAGPVDPGRVLDLLEDPPQGAYRIKGLITVRSGRGLRGYVVHLVGRSVHVSSTPTTGPCELVAIGYGLDAVSVRERLEHALAPSDAAHPAGVRRLQVHRRRSL